jgi:transcriptional regulator GlxA family with amidase domain
MTPYQYYIYAKILKAERLLEESDDSVKETAFRLGFDDPYYFPRSGRQKIKRGINPPKNCLSLGIISLKAVQNQDLGQNDPT